MSGKTTSDSASRTDWQRIDAMGDEDIAYDRDTGAPLAGEDIAAGIRTGLNANGTADFLGKIKTADK